LLFKRNQAKSSRPRRTRKIAGSGVSNTFEDDFSSPTSEAAIAAGCSKNEFLEVPLFLFPSFFRCLFKAAVSPLLYLADFGWQAVPPIFTYFLPKPQNQPRFLSNPAAPGGGRQGKRDDQGKNN